MVTRYLKLGMPYTTLEDAKRWKALNVRSWYTPGSAPVAPAPAAGLDADDLADLLEAAGEALAASLIFECDVPPGKVGLVVNTFALILSDALEARGDPENHLFMIDGPDLADPAVRARVDARIAALRAERAADA
jgi:hypothetical protein